MSKRSDLSFLLILTLISLAFFSLIFVYSSSSIKSLSLFKKDYFFLKRQTIFYSLGFLSMFIFSKINYNVYKKYKNFLFLLALSLSLAVLVPGIGMKINGARRWLKIGFFNLNPSEIVKFSLIIFLSSFLEKAHEKEWKNFKVLLPSLVIIGIHILPIMIEDLGTAFQIALTGMSMLYLAQVGLFYFLFLFLTSIPLLSVFIIKSGRFKRINYFLNSFSNEYNYQLKQSLIGIGKGGLLGCNIGNSLQKYAYLPEAHTDFIFSVISEEGGLIFSAFILLCYLLILFIGFKASINADNLFGRYLALGFTLSITYQAIINIAVAMGLIPATGIPLPFISHGGGSIIMNMVFMGILINILKSAD